MLMTSGGAVRLADAAGQPAPVQVERESEPDDTAADDRDLHRSSPRKSAAIVDRGANEDK
jgi:hypothetical protein